MRNTIYALIALGIARHTGALTARYALTVLCESTLCAALTPMLLILSCDPGESVVALLQHTRTCPPRLDGLRRRSAAAAHAVRSRYFQDEPLLDSFALAVVCAFAMVVTVRLASADTPPPVRQTSMEIFALVGVLLVGAAVTKLRPTDAKALSALADRLALDGAAKVMAALRARLATAPSEAAILAAGAEALRSLYPGAAAAALAAFAEGSGTECVALMHCEAAEERARAALAAALPAAVGAPHPFGEAGPVRKYPLLIGGLYFACADACFSLRCRAPACMCCATAAAARAPCATAASSRAASARTPTGPPPPPRGCPPRRPSPRC